ncbi:MAG: LPXTG cell wall anchor domain-containing protein [Glycomyces artemisiae]|uniref:LPXTG cell wall anchor domain-containing protein n=1 Tax=Glycomyces artemisiae TaxID=1076443 RepID=A0A2T0UW34_9ACTN|nr:LPXTG cell wall anchor domain-containing protein [Glycomyces artemisiae]NUQ89514.1 LPXTG cell wall anchor domain-containing protein [Glycomyces artemisiae]PRY62141.1 LPXTG-motif cell wall-anchored protein [Glycomyces artemisiae]
MNRTLKRVLGLAGSAVLGLAGAVTFASAAQAHHVEITGYSECTDDGWTVTWEATDWNSQNLGAGVVTALSAELEGDLQVGASLPHPSTGEVITGTQTLSLDQATAELKIDAEWPNGQEGSGTGVVSQPEGGCEAPEEPTPEVEAGGYSDCFGVFVYGDNYNPEALAEFTFDPSNGDAVSYTPEVDEGAWEYFLLDDPETGLTVDILVDGELYTTIEWVDNPLCHYVTAEADCDGLNFTISVPEDGEETTFYFYTSYDESETVEVVAPGESKTITVPAQNNEEFSVFYWVETQKDSVYGEVPWTPCPPEETPSESPSPKPELPKTGSSLSIMIGSAAALIVAAGVIFFLMRRRRAAQDW